MVRSTRPLLLSLLVACASPRVAAPATAAANGTTALPGSSQTAPRGPLKPNAHFTELVRAAIAREGHASTGADCLLAREAEGFTLHGDLASALRPLPLPPADLDEPLRRSEPVEILSAWGRYGDGSGGLSLAGFTLAKPTPSAAALMITDRGFSVRSVSGDPRSTADARTLDELLAKLGPEPDRTLFVTAEAAIPLTTLAETLGELERRALPVALAVALAADTLLPPPARATARVSYCPSGLPATEASEGSLPTEALRAGIAPLQQQASACIGRGDARGAAGGRLALSLRVGPGGRVQDACVTEDALGDNGVLACVLDLARKLSFASPAPSGVVDIGLPIVLLPSGGTGQRPLCPSPGQAAPD